MVNVALKWGPKKFDVELTESPLNFMNSIFCLTGVPVERQKLMSKAWKGMLKSDDDVSKFAAATDGMQVMLMGTAEVVPEPVQKTIFVEDMSVSEVVQAGALLPAGLNNLGNTCYMNSTVQCYRAVPELQEGLLRYESGISIAARSDPSQRFAMSLRDTFASLDASAQPVSPFSFVQSLRTCFPQFAEQANGAFKQQDADEFIMSMTEMLSQRLTNGVPELRPSVASLSAASSAGWVAHPLPSLAPARNLIEALFAVEMESTLTCLEGGSEGESVRREIQGKLVCNIQGGAGSAVQINHLNEGLLLGMEGDVEKHAPSLGRNALFRKRQRIARLPRYICVQFMRFYWKATPDSRDHAGVKCKMMRPVSFPATLDLFEFCSDELKSILRPHRDRDSAPSSIGAAAAAAASSAMDIDADATATAGGSGSGAGEDAELAAALALSMGAPVPVPAPTSIPSSARAPVVSSAPAGIGLPPSFTGHYELFAMVTHKGRSADSGHYVGWTKARQGAASDDWLCFDDDTVTECKLADALACKGGGDQHMAYLTFYRYKQN